MFRERPLGMNLRNYLIRDLNPEDAVARARDKAQFKRVLRENGIPAPLTLYEISDYSDIARLRTLPGEFVIKPNHGMGGNGILVVKREDDVFISPANERYTLEDVRGHLRKIVNGEFSDNIERDQALIEERIYPSPDLVFRYAAGLPDIRVFCFRSVPVMAMVRYSTEISRGRANLSQGAVGMGLDMMTGGITHIHAKKETEDYTPDFFGIPADFRVPRWEEIRTVASETARVSGLSVAGVDVVLNSAGQIMVLEVNGHPGIEIQNINERSLLEALQGVHYIL